MRRREIPRVPPTADAERRGFDEATKERLEVIAGLRGVKIALLDPATATASDCAGKINEILALLQ
jgi:hypothetical protein